MRLIANLAVVVVFGLSIGITGRTDAKDSLPPMSKPLVALSGADSHVKKPSYRRITTPDEWARVWAVHLGTTKDDAYRPRLEVDFDRCLVVVIFRGEEINVRGIQIDSSSETAQSIEVLFTELTYQTAGESNKKPPDRPYAFIVVPKTTKSIVLKENAPSLKNEFPNWKEVARLKGDRKADE